MKNKGKINNRAIQIVKPITKKRIPIKIMLKKPNINLNFIF